MSATEQYRAAALHRVPRLYFPVSSSQTQDFAGPNHPLVHGSPAGDAVLESDDERAHYLAAKRAILQRDGRGPLRLREAGSEAAIARAETFVRAQLTRAEPARTIGPGLDALMLEIQEDLVVMQKPAGYAAERARAHYVHVCFPSHWSPARMLGKNFLSLHARVPWQTGFERADRARHASALFAEPAVRFVWSLTPDALLDHHPDSQHAADWNTTDAAFLRVERQVIVPLPAAVGQASVTLFFIRTYVYPSSRLHDAQRRELLAAMADMTESVRRYKGMLGHETRIAELLWAGPSHALRAHGQPNEKA